MLFLMAFALAADPVKPVIPEGHVVYSIKLDATRANGFFAPGSYVDVVLVETVDKGKLNASYAGQRLLIVAVDSFKREDGEQNMTVSLAVKPLEATALDEARKKGKLELTLRDPSKEKK
jgi:Flp pilus assembly protein CpaB